MNYPPFDLFKDPCTLLHTYLFGLLRLCNSWTDLIFFNLPLIISLLNSQLTVGIIESPATHIWGLFFKTKGFFLYI